MADNKDKDLQKAKEAEKLKLQNETVSKDSHLLRRIAVDDVKKAVKTLTSVAEIAGGVATGNPELIAKGGKDLAKGAVNELKSVIKDIVPKPDIPNTPAKNEKQEDTRTNAERSIKMDDLDDDIFKRTPTGKLRVKKQMNKTDKANFDKEGNVKSNLKEQEQELESIETPSERAERLEVEKKLREEKKERQRLKRNQSRQLKIKLGEEGDFDKVMFILTQTLDVWGPYKEAIRDLIYTSYSIDNGWTPKEKRDALARHLINSGILSKGAWTYSSDGQGASTGYLEATQIIVDGLAKMGMDQKTLADKTKNLEFF